ncbi:hypothetical protein GBA52_025847 [Prunus armeniaca]|nr:hypothetical protein GBA52_025847 [Prunus armeniaca]
MVRLPIPTANNCNSNFGSKKQQCLYLLNLCVTFKQLSQVHAQIQVSGFQRDHFLLTQLIRFCALSPSKNFNYARTLLDHSESSPPSSWNFLIRGYASSDTPREAILGLSCNARPGHAGQVDDGYQYFHDMEHVHGIKPMMIHYGAMVDILGRAGRLNEAYSFIMSMPFDPDPIVWRTLLSACNTCDDNDDEGVGNKVSEKLLELEPSRGGNLVMVANMYAEVGMWEKAANLRKVMKERRVKKTAGESCVELGGSIHKFFSGYDSLELIMRVSTSY